MLTLSLVPFSESTGERMGEGGDCGSLLDFNAVFLGDGADRSVRCRLRVLCSESVTVTDLSLYERRLFGVSRSASGLSSSESGMKTSAECCIVGTGKA